MDQHTLKRVYAVAKKLDEGRAELEAINAMFPDYGEPPWDHLPKWVIPGRVIDYLQQRDYSGAMAFLLAVQEENESQAGLVWG